MSSVHHPPNHDALKHDILKPVVILSGPTAIGKTTLSIQLAKRLQTLGQACAIISADSRLVYRHVNIGTAKPSPLERQQVPHHLIDMVMPDEAYSVARYQEDATREIAACHGLGILPIVVGGTGFYIKALLQNPSLVPPVPPDAAFREALTKEASEKGVLMLYERLKTLDPERACALYDTDLLRIIRALEIIHTTGKKASSFRAKSPEPARYKTLWLGLSTSDPEWLRRRIASRVHAMMEEGWLTEVRQLLNHYGPDAPGLRISHGYPELIRHVQTGWPLEEALSKTILNIQQYARRQRTWFRPNTAITWTAVDQWPTPSEASLWVQQQGDYILNWCSERRG
ncbi:MAG: tRNA (adenosine(37)-N6)-dimethylallyltransferase MiaA [Vampirovibrionales bacterium]|nr:tRNA (adenosine(37)-N6)-dimethylallyltransferase MiaA [Vampirovibrionales bacterium]